MNGASSAAQGMVCSACLSLQSPLEDPVCLQALSAFMQFNSDQWLGQLYSNFRNIQAANWNGLMKPVRGPVSLKNPRASN